MAQLELWQRHPRKKVLRGQRLRPMTPSGGPPHQPTRSPPPSLITHRCVCVCVCICGVLGCRDVPCTSVNSNSHLHVLAHSTELEGAPPNRFLKIPHSFTAPLSTNGIVNFKYVHKQDLMFSSITSMQTAPHSMRGCFLSPLWTHLLSHTSTCAVCVCVGLS